MNDRICPIDCAAIREDEPVFVLHGRDILAYEALNRYHELVHLNIGESEMSRQIAGVCVEFMKYRAANPGKMKSPSPHKKPSNPVQIKVNVDGGTNNPSDMEGTMHGLYGKPLTVHNEDGTTRRNYSLSDSQSANEASFAAKQKEVHDIFRNVLDQALESEIKRQKEMVERVLHNVCDIISEYLDATARGESNIARDHAAEAFFRPSEDVAEMAKLFDDRAKHTREIQDGIISTLKSRLK